jgi:two-component system sensor histidine kinase TctE
LPDAVTTALAISRDTALSGGDALSEDTRDLLRDTSGGAVFYHVYAPDGVFVTGYATPPVPPSMAFTADGQTYLMRSIKANLCGCYDWCCQTNLTVSRPIPIFGN